MGIYVRAEKIAGDDRAATYSFTNGSGDYAPRTMLIDLDGDVIRPEDGRRDGIFNGAALAIIRGYQREGRLPATALLQA